MRDCLPIVILDLLVRFLIFAIIELLYYRLAQNAIFSGNLSEFFQQTPLFFSPILRALLLAVLLNSCYTIPMKENIKKALENNQEALHSLVILHRASDTIYKQEIETMKKYKLTIGQFGVLEALYNKGNLRIQELIDKLLSTSGNMTVVIRNMIRDGYIIKVADERDKRASLISLTDFGRETIEAILPEHYTNIGRIFEVLSLEEQENLNMILKKFKR